MIATDDTSARTLALLEKGFRTNAVHLKSLEEDMDTLLGRARELGTGGAAASTDGSPTAWSAGWDTVQASLHRIVGEVNAMEDSIESDDTDRLETALARWQTIQDEDEVMRVAFQDLKAQAATREADGKAQETWALLAHEMQSHLETVSACARALWIKVQWSKAHTKEEVARLIQECGADELSDPSGSGLDGKAYSVKYQEAAKELDEEQHEVFGFRDTLNALFMWKESPEERLRAKRSLEE